MPFIKNAYTTLPKKSQQAILQLWGFNSVQFKSLYFEDDCISNRHAGTYYQNVCKRDFFCLIAASVLFEKEKEEVKNL